MHNYELVVHEVGRGDPVLLLNGPGGLASHLLPLATALGADHRVLVPSFPGEGGTPAYPGKYTMQHELTLLEEALFNRGIAHTHIVGFSGGAYRGFALAVSNRVRALSIVSLGGYAGLAREMSELMYEFAQTVRARAMPDDALVSRMLSPSFARDNPAAVDEVSSWVRSQDPEGLAQQLEASAAGIDLTPKLRGLQIPIIARTGELDLAVPPALSRQIVAAAVRAELEIVPAAGHALLHEDFANTLVSIKRAFVLGLASAPA